MAGAGGGRPELLQAPEGGLPGGRDSAGGLGACLKAVSVTQLCFLFPGLFMEGGQWQGWEVRAVLGTTPSKAEFLPLLPPPTSDPHPCQHSPQATWFCDSTRSPGFGVTSGSTEAGVWQKCKELIQIRNPPTQNCDYFSFCFLQLCCHSLFTGGF